MRHNREIEAGGGAPMPATSPEDAVSPSAFGISVAEETGDATQDEASVVDGRCAESFGQFEMECGTMDTVGVNEAPALNREARWTSSRVVASGLTLNISPELEIGQGL